MDTRESLLAEVESFLKREGMAPTTLGKLAVNDGKFVHRLRAGANLTLATIARVEAFMRRPANDDPEPPPGGASAKHPAQRAA